MLRGMHSSLWTTILLALALVFPTDCLHIHQTKEDILSLNKNDIEYMNFSEIISYYHYPVESHDVVTEDGFILTIARIPYNSTIAGGQKKRGVFFLQHCLLCSATDF
eukprot:Awhi_evm1s13936